MWHCTGSETGCSLKTVRRGLFAIWIYVRMQWLIQPKYVAQGRLRGVDAHAEETTVLRTGLDIIPRGKRRKVPLLFSSQMISRREHDVPSLCKCIFNCLLKKPFSYSDRQINVWIQVSHSVLASNSGTLGYNSMMRWILASSALYSSVHQMCSSSHPLAWLWLNWLLRAFRLQTFWCLLSGRIIGHMYKSQQS